MAARVRAALTPALARRSVPVVVDAASCTEGYRALLAGDGAAPVLHAPARVVELGHGAGAPRHHIEVSGQVVGSDTINPAAQP